MRKTLIAANWKMNKTAAQARQFASDFVPRVGSPLKTDIVICPPFTCLSALQESLKETPVELGGQDLFWEEKGAYTGEISAAMLLELGCGYVIVGHSERRQIIGETDVIVNRKLKAALAAGLVPILCVGETREERQNKKARLVVETQLKGGLKDVVPATGQIVIAYEPVWAIGSGVNASSGDAQQMMGFIRSYLAGTYNPDLAESIRILYGGSVKKDNLADFLQEKDIDGALVGGASLEPASLAELVRIGEHGK